MSSVVVGREREITEAVSFLERAACRSAGLVIVGEPGIGKTTIWTAIVDRAVAEPRTLLVARPTEAESELAFAVLIDLLGALEEDVLATLAPSRHVALEVALRRREGGPAVDPAAVALAVTDCIAALSSSGPVLIAIDDLQWVDAPSLRALTFALRRLPDAPIGLVATVRAGFESELTSLAGQGDARVGRVELGGLTKRHLAQLVLDRTGRALTPSQLGRLVELSRGNPFYALELAATGDPALPVPESLAGALRARLSTLSPSARAVGLTAGTLGRFDESLHTSIHPRGLRELRDAAVAVIRGGTPSFAHPLLASTLLDMHTTAERRAVHRSLAAALSDPDERALHLGRATDVRSEEIAAELEHAAERLDLRGAPETAAGLVERAAATTPEADVASRNRRLIRASDLYQAAGEGREHVQPLLEHLVSTLPPGADRARALVRLGWLGAQIDTISTVEAIAYQERALDEAEGAPDVHAAAHAVLARMRGIGGDYRSALGHAELAVSAAHGAPANLMFPSPHGELGIARLFTGGGFDEQLFLDGIAAESGGREEEPYQSVRLRYALALLYTGDTSRARAVLHELLERSRELDRVRSVAGCILHLVELEVRSGDLDVAEEHAREFAHLDRQLRGERGKEWYPSGLVASRLGHVDDARRILHDGVEYSRAIESAIWLAHHLEALGHLELSTGNHEAAREALAEVPALLRNAGLGEWSVHPFHPDAIETLVELGELDEAEALLAELEEYARRLDRPWGLATAGRSAALVALAHGEAEEALASLERALREHDRLGWPLERARTLLVRGRALRRLGRRRDAAAALAEAGSAFAALRNPLWHAKVEAEERRLGGRRRAAGVLTPTEQRVADLAGQGLRNAEIAARLYVTPKTVEATLSRVYRKLGVRSRTELARRGSDLPSATSARDATPSAG